MSTYDASPVTAESPISIEEVDALIASGGKPVIKDTRKFMHLLGRTRIAIVAYRSQIRALNNDIQQIQLQSERSGAATTLNPRDAVRYLSPEQLGELVEGHMREKLAVVERSLAEANQAKQKANAHLAQLRFATVSLMEDSSIPSEVRDRFKTLMKKMPEEPGSAPTKASTNSTKPAEDLGELFS